MYGGRGGGGNGEMVDRKRMMINDALNKHLEKSSPSTSRGDGKAKDKEPISVPSTSSGKSRLKHNCSDDADGAYFGTTFPTLFLMAYRHLDPQKPTTSYIPRVFGFKIHKS